MNLTALFNPAHAPRVDIAMYKLAQGNSAITLGGLLLTTVTVAAGFGATLDPVRLSLWTALMLAAAVMGFLSHRALHLPGKQDPLPQHVAYWRHIQTYTFLIEGVAWGALGLLFDPASSATQNTLLLLFYLGAISVGGHASAAHSYRLFLVTVICSLPVLLPFLSNGFGEYALPLGVMIVLYAGFIARVSRSSQQTLLRSVELQIENESLLKEKAVAMQLAERERIYRDLHDDVGAKLLGLAISAQRANQPREADLARSALQDLRDVVSRSAHASTRLDDLLADWRAESTQRLQSAGIELKWDIPAGEQPVPVTPHAALHIGRILREALSNVLKHARATQVSIQMSQNHDELLLCIRDNGIGLPQTRGNRGMSNMKSRASALGGGITWETLASGGCQVTVRLSLPHLSAEQQVLALAS